MCVGGWGLGGRWALILPYEANLPSAGLVITLNGVEPRSGHCFTLSRLTKVSTSLDIGLAVSSF